MQNGFVWSNSVFQKIKNQICQAQIWFHTAQRSKVEGGQLVPWPGTSPSAPSQRNLLTGKKIWYTNYNCLHIRLRYIIFHCVNSFFMIHKNQIVQTIKCLPATTENAIPREAALRQRRSITPLEPRSVTLFACLATNVFRFPVGIGPAWNSSL